MEDWDLRYQEYLQEIESFLQRLFEGGQPYDRLQEAMRYSLLSGGKRIRPVLTLAFCASLGGAEEKALPLACALELMHTYSLIHDDLPCMDDDEFRRGRLTCHTVYGEATAVLAGDALQAEAFKMIASASALTSEQRADAVLVLADACGSDGMTAGQILDVEQLVTNEQELRLLCHLKTGRLLCAAAELGCIAAGGSGGDRQTAVEYARHLGLAFQVRDDMLDVTAVQAELGKPVGSDRAAGKQTFVDMIGLEACAALVAKETELAQNAIAGFADCRFLRELAGRLADRRK